MPSLIVGGRGSGKTTRCIELAYKNDAYIVSRTHAHAIYTAGLARKMGISIHHPITYDEYFRGEFHNKNINGFVVDDVDELMSYLARGVPVIGMSLYAMVPPESQRPAAWEPPESKP